MSKAIATTVAALMLAGLSFSAGVAPAAAAQMFQPMHPVHSPIMVRHAPHWHQHKVCETQVHHHHRVTVCTWAGNGR
jgi:Spy/CpxP family protein refolding chaperone